MERDKGFQESEPHSSPPEDPKLSKLFEVLRNLRRVTVLLSGGVDSACLAWAARKALPPSEIHLLTFICPLVEEEERRLAQDVASSLDLPWTLLEVPSLEVPEVRENGPRRCYFCRKTMHARGEAWRREHHKGVLLDGVHREDRKEYRPGLEAAEEDGIRHPLEEAELNKEEIRQYARKAGFPHWNRPPRPCLATRFPPGTLLEETYLRRVGRGEAFLREAGFPRGRLRFFPPGAAVLELPEEDLFRALERREYLVTSLRALGFPIVSLDLEGHRRGKMERFLENETTTEQS